MRRLFLALTGSAVLCVGLSQFAWAADMPVKAPVYKAEPAVIAYNWSGFYVGLNAGGNWGRSQPSTTTALSGAFAGCPGCLVDIASAGADSFDTSGFTGGVFAGYNYQFSNLLVGVEIDFQYFRSAGSNVVNAVSITCPCNFTVTSSLATDWLFTVRPRLGFVAGNWLFYGTGGLAVTKLKANWSYTDDFAGGPGFESASASAIRTGWAAGGGIEITTARNWLIGVEYLHVDFNSISAISTNWLPPAPGTVFGHSADLKSDIVRARLSKKL